MPNENNENPPPDLLVSLIPEEEEGALSTIEGRSDSLGKQLSTTHFTNSMDGHLCLVCSANASILCPHCNSVWYCSIERITEDWPRHRVNDRPLDPSLSNGRTEMTLDGQTSSPISFKEVSSMSPVSIAQFNAILFPWNEERPRIISVSCLRHSPEGERPIWIPMLQDFLGGIHDVTSMVATQGINGEPLRFPFHLFHGTNSPGDGTLANRSIQSLTNGQATYPWAGNVIALKFSGGSRRGYKDAAAIDFPTLAAFFVIKQED